MPRARQFPFPLFRTSRTLNSLITSWCASRKHMQYKTALRFSECQYGPKRGYLYESIFIRAFLFWNSPLAHSARHTCGRWQPAEYLAGQCHLHEKEQCGAESFKIVLTDSVHFFSVSQKSKVVWRWIRCGVWGDVFPSALEPEAVTAVFSLLQVKLPQADKQVPPLKSSAQTQKPLQGCWDLPYIS